MLASKDKNPDVAHAPQHSRDPGLESPVLDDIDFFGGGRMSATGPTSPFIKDEPDWDFGSMPNQRHLNMQMQHQQYPQVASGSIDPNDLSAHHQQDALGSFNFNAPPGNMTSSFNMGNSGIGDDELADLDFNDARRRSNQQPHGMDQMGEFSFDQQQGHMQGMFASNTPNGEPMQSPFLQTNFSSYYQQQMASPRQRPVSGGGAMAEYGMAGPRRSLPHAMDRKPSDSRSPMTPKTPALGGLNLGGTPESGSLGTKPMSALTHRHHKSLSEQWDQSPHSYSIESPMASPGGMGGHAGIGEVLRSAKGAAASVPSKMEHHGPAYQSQEAKRRRRRESHNLVERRRRDNINERIQELSHLVPLHRLEDEKVRKYLANNGPLSPSINPTSVSPPQATSMLAAGGRRATGPGAITMGLPAVDDKEKGPNKGDILNGSVSWTRDLMWSLHVKMEQEKELRALIEQLGGAWPFTETDEQRRMRSELTDAMDKNEVSTFSYSRFGGSGLRVPGHTDHAGNTLTASGSGGAISPQSLSPGNQASSSNSDQQTQPQFWNNAGVPASLKEEDEFDITMA